MRGVAPVRAARSISHQSPPSQPPVHRTAPLNRYEIYDSCLIVSREDNPPAAYSGLSPSARVCDASRRSGSRAGCGSVRQCSADSLLEVPVQTVEVFASPAGELDTIAQMAFSPFTCFHLTFPSQSRTSNRRRTASVRATPPQAVHPRFYATHSVRSWPFPFRRRVYPFPDLNTCRRRSGQGRVA